MTHLMHVLLLCFHQAVEVGVITPPTQPTLKGLLPIRPRSESPARVKQIVRSVLDWEPEHADEMVYWPCAEGKCGSVDSSDVAAAATLKSSGGEEGDLGAYEDVEENANEDWPVNLAGMNGAALAASAARRLAKALNVDASLVVSQLLLCGFFPSLVMLYPPRSLLCRKTVWQSGYER